MHRIFVLFVLGVLAGRTPAVERGPLLILGGGDVPDEVHRQLVELGGGREARVVVVPFASSLTNAGESTAEDFRPFGVQSVEVLSMTNRGAARAALERATVIWFTGGDQARLMARLNELSLVEVVRKRHARGAVVGGTSAGAAVMSKVMIAGDALKADEPPLIAQGLGLWPEAIVDQHFVKRGREPRLSRTVTLHRELLGVGIDEGTAVVVRGQGFEVIGTSTVTVLDARRQLAAPEKTVLSAGQKFSVTPTASPR